MIFLNFLFVKPSNILTEWYMQQIQPDKNFTVTWKKKIMFVQAIYFWRGIVIIKKIMKLSVTYLIVNIMKG